MFERIYQASPTVAARKNVQAISVKPKVTQICTAANMKLFSGTPKW